MKTAHLQPGRPPSKQEAVAAAAEAAVVEAAAAASTTCTKGLHPHTRCRPAAGEAAAEGAGAAAGEADCRQGLHSGSGVVVNPRQTGIHADLSSPKADTVTMPGCKAHVGPAQSADVQKYALGSP